MVNILRVKFTSTSFIVICVNPSTILFDGNQNDKKKMRLNHSLSLLFGLNVTHFVKYINTLFDLNINNN